MEWPSPRCGPGTRNTPATALEHRPIIRIVIERHRSWGNLGSGSD